MVLPNLVSGHDGPAFARLPFVYALQNGVWQDLTERDTLDLPGLRRLVTSQLYHLMDGLDADPAANLMLALKSHCRQLYQRLVPRRLHNLLLELEARAGEQGQPAELRFHSPIEWIPWELFYDPDHPPGFLGLRFQVARLPIVASGAGLAPDACVPVGRIYHLLGRNVLDQNQQAEWARTFELDVLDGTVRELRYPSGDGARDFPGLADLEQVQQPGILHFTCHGGLEAADGAVYWTLDERAPIADEYRIHREIVEILGETLYLRGSTPLVFGNACASTRADRGEENPPAGLVLGFGPTFFQQGAGAFVGTFAPVSKTTAIAFARRFYQHLLAAGLPVGQALWQARQDFHRRGSNDPSYLFYTLYGLPGTRFLPIQTQ
jgi:hypothetical protein